MFERPQRGERAILVHIDFKHHLDASDPNEFKELAFAAGAEIMGFIYGTRVSPDSKYFVGSGKLDEIAEAIAVESAELVMFNHELSPAQERNLERHLKCRVISRTGLILDIFAQRARTFEGKLQVELAQLEHLSTRLIRGWTHLERQKGGIGLRGPGETQLETDRRLLRERIKHIQRRLARVRTQRQQGRRARKRNEIPTIALVGYTNVGKSTLFNALTQANTLVANQLFATLDPTLRVISIPGIGQAVLADTVGFVSHLPHTLVDAFKATLEEVQEANLLLHVVDAYDEQSLDNMHAVNQVLKEINADSVPQILVYNKSDLLPHGGVKPGTTEPPSHERPGRAWVSALAQSGLEELITLTGHALTDKHISGILELKPEEGKLHAQFHQLEAIKSETLLPTGGWQILFQLSIVKWHAFCHQWPELEARFLKDNQ